MFLHNNQEDNNSGESFRRNTVTALGFIVWLDGIDIKLGYTNVSIWN
ncbi:hypothetical protein [Hyunsoonleella rubra]|uniref:Uncharacterized protein n=1 Tax=Hyunsoonleella rubra TaxID=1737062 RepID=A0ABW5TD13_9FLAO